MFRKKRRDPLPGPAILRARAVRAELEYHHPTELEIDVLAHMRGVLVNASPASGARANILRVGSRGFISVADHLPNDQRRWAIAHELGHFEAHPHISYLGLCTGEDLRFDYDTSGREQEANAFAAELLMPEDLFERKCDVAKLSWAPILDLASEFQVSVTAAALRLLSFTYERAAVMACKDGKVVWSQATRDFGRRIVKGTPLDRWSLAYDFFAKGKVSRIPETVSAEAWIPDAAGDDEVNEHVFPMPEYNMVLSLLWFPVE